MRSFPLAALLLCGAVPADAAVEIDINKDTQTMTVAVDGVTRYRWPVSSGLPAYETPSGAYKAFRMEEDHYSKEWDDAPMPHSIFFTKRGHAIHGTDAVSRLGNPASHGCVRLSRANASTLFALVKQEGVLNTSVTLSGSSQVALARNPQRRNATASRGYDVDGLPPPQQIAPQQYGGNGYYVEEYDSSGRRLPSPQRGQGYRRNYNADSYYAEQQQPAAPFAQPRYYGRQPYPGQTYVNPYAQPRYYRQRDYYSYGY